MGILALGMSDYMTMSEAMLAGFGNSCVLLVLFCLLFAAYLDEAGINKIIAYWFIRHKICIGRPWIFSLMLLIAAYVLGFAVSLFAAIVLCWSLFYSICEISDIKAGEAYAVEMIIGLCYSACLGVSILAFKPIPVIVYSTLEVYLGIGVDYLKFAIVTFGVSFPCLLVYWGIMKYIIRPDVSKLSLAAEKISQEPQPEINKEQKVAFLMLAIFFAMLFLPSFLSKSSWLYLFLNRLTTTGIVAVMVLLVCVLKINDQSLADFTTLIKKGVVWDLILVFVAIMPLSTAMADESTGILAQVIILADKFFVDFSPLTFSILLLVIVLLCSQFIYNVIVATVATPILCTYAVQFGADPAALAVVMCFALAMALGTPAASGMAAMMYGNKQWLKQKQVMTNTLMILLINLFMMLLIGLPLSSLIF